MKQSLAKLFFATISAFPCVSNAQVLQRPNPFAPGVIMQFVGGDSGTIVGTSKGKPDAPPQFVKRDSLAVLRYDKVNGKLWLYRPETGDYDDNAFGSNSSSAPTMQQTFDASLSAGFGYQVTNHSDSHEIGLSHSSEDYQVNSVLILGNTGASLFGASANGTAVISASGTDGSVSLFGADNKIAINGIIYRYPNVPDNLAPNQSLRIESIDQNHVVNLAYGQPLEIHPKSGSETPTITGSAPAGTLNAISITGTDEALTFTVTVAAGKSVSGSLCAIIYSKEWEEVPKVIISNTSLDGSPTDNIRVQAQATDKGTINVSARIPSSGTYSFTIFSKQ